MKKKYFKIFSLVAGIIILLFILINLGVNFWLKNKLPNYIKTQSEYVVTYKTLDVDLATGAVFSTGITINSKNPDRTDKLGLQGTVDTLSVSRFGIYDMIVHKKINTSDITLAHPNLNIILPQKSKKNDRAKTNDFAFKNITITKGIIQVYQPTKQKAFSVRDLNLKVQNLAMNEESLQNKLPFTLDHYAVNGKNLYFRPDNVYAFTAKDITTREDQISVKDFAVTPLLSYRNLTRFYPKKGNLINFKSTQMDFKEIVLKGNKVSLQNVRFENPELEMFTTKGKNEPRKIFAYDVNLNDVLVNNAKIKVLNPDGSSIFSAQNLSMDFNKFKLNSETLKQKIPFQYDNFKLNGTEINVVSGTQNVKLASVSMTPHQLAVKSLFVKPTVSSSTQTLLDLAAQNVDVKIREFNFLQNKLNLKVDQVLINQLSGKIVGAANPQQTKRDFNGIVFPLTVKNVSIKNSDLTYSKGDQPLVVKNLNADFQNLEMNSATVKEKIPFKMGFYRFATSSFQYGTQFYNFSASLINGNSNSLQVSKFAMIPKVSRAQFIRMIPAEKDLYNITANQILMNGKWDFLSNQPFLNASRLILDGVDANIFRSKIPKDDLTEKPLYSKLLRSIKFPLLIENLDLKNSVLIYEEDTKKSDGPGKLTFNKFNMSLKNLNSAKIKGKPTLVPIAINCLFMNVSPMNVNWSFDTANLNDAFSISGNVENLPAERINPFIEPYLKIQATGLISDLLFNFKGNKEGLNGVLKMKHENLKVSVLKKDGEKNTVLSAIANIFVKTDSGNYPESVDVEDVQRDKTKSFFNLFWHGIEQGLKKTLIGKNAPQTEKTIKKTVDNTKAALEENQKDLKQTKLEAAEKAALLKDKVQQTTEKIKEKGGLKNILKKKTDTQ